MPVTYSPLRYPGGKSQLIPFIIETLRTNHLFDGAYIEPFAGGAGIAWHLLLKGYVQEVYINDLDPSIYAFWHSVLNNTASLCQMIEETPISIEQWFYQKSIQTKSNATVLELGFSTLFLNRTNRSGIIKGGVIGGRSQNGNYKLDCRFNKENLIKKIKDIALFKEEIFLFNLDANEFLSHKLPPMDQPILINIDPPYYVKGKGLYQNFFEHDDHIHLHKTIKNISHPWIVTYDNVPEINECYQEYNPTPFSLNYSVQKKYLGSEVIIHGPGVTPCSFRPGVKFNELRA